MTSHRGPLSDLRIVAIEQYGAGPWGTVHLAELGAEVIKIEDPVTAGDVGRHVPPYQEGQHSVFFEAFNRNKRSVALDLRSPQGRRVLEDLVAVSDAVYSNLRGDVPGRLRITYEDLKHLNPRIVCCSLSSYGTQGSMANQPGYDYILQAVAGWMDLTGEPGGPPTKTGLSLVDFSGGLTAVAALLAGIHSAKRDGVGMDCDVSLYDTAISMLNYPAAWHLSRGYVPSRARHSAHPSLVPFQAFEASDAWFVVACAKEKFWQRLATVLDRTEWITDVRFASFAARQDHRAELIPLLESEFRQRTATDWVELLTAAGVPTARVLTVPEALQSDLVSERDLLIAVDHPVLGEVRQLASPVRVGPARTEHRRAPYLGEDTDDVLVDLLGYDQARVDQLRMTGALGQQLPDPSDQTSGTGKGTQ